MDAGLCDTRLDACEGFSLFQQRACERQEITYIGQDLPSARAAGLRVGFVGVREGEDARR